MIQPADIVKALLDTNVAIDYLLQREPYEESPQKRSLLGLTPGAACT